MTEQVINQEVMNAEAMNAAAMQRPTGGEHPLIVGMHEMVHDFADRVSMQATLMTDQVADWASDHKEGIIKKTAILAAGFMGVTAVAACGSSSEEKTAAQSDMDALRAALTVKDTDPSVDCVELVNTHGGETVETEKGTVIVFDVGAKKGVEAWNPELRQWSDAISTPLTAPEADKAGLLKEIQASICEDPLLGETVANMFANMQVGELKVVDLNKWLQGSAGSADQINDRAAAYNPALNASSSDEEFEAARDKNFEWQDKAEHLNTLLKRFQNNGVEKGITTTLNYNLAGDGLSIDGLPEVQVNPEQYQADAITLVINRKGLSDCIVKIGFNVGDQRPETFECAAPPAPTPEVPETPDQPDQPHKPGTTVTTGKPGTTTTTEWTPPKGPAHPPVPGGPPTTVEAPKPGPDHPTTSTTAAPTTSTTQNHTAPTSVPGGEFNG